MKASGLLLEPTAANCRVRARPTSRRAFRGRAGRSTGGRRTERWRPSSGRGRRADPAALPRGRERASGSGGSDGGSLGAAGGAGAAGGLGFERDVPPGGYAWWYLDALSDDGEEAITLIAFVGSVFSPYYAWSGRADPLDHTALNVALYARRGGRWTLTERGRGDLRARATGCASGRARSRSRGTRCRSRSTRWAVRSRGARAERCGSCPSSAPGTRSGSPRRAAIAGGRSRRARGSRSRSRSRGRAGRATAISTATGATPRSSRPSTPGPGRGLRSRAGPRCSTTPCRATVRRARWPCASTPRERCSPSSRRRARRSPPRSSGCRARPAAKARRRSCAR